MKKKIFCTLFFTSLKSFGSIVFSLFLISVYGHEEHVKFMEHISLLLLASLMSRMASEQAILKHGYHLLNIDESHFRDFLNGVFSRVIISSTILGFVLFIYTDYFLDVFFVPLVSVSYLYISIIGVKGKAEFSSILEVGFSFLLTMIISFLLNLNFEIIYYSLFFSWLIVILVCYAFYPVKFKFSFFFKESRASYIDYFYRIPLLSLNSFLNYFTNWGVILISTIIYSDQMASDFTLAIRVCACFNVIMAAITAFVSPQIRNKLDQGVSTLNEYFSKFRSVYFYSGFSAYILLYIFMILLNSYVQSVPYIDIYTVMIIAFGYAFNVATGPKSMAMVLVGEEKLLLIIRVLAILFLILGIILLDSKLFVFSFSLYLVVQSIMIIYMIKIKRKVSVTYL